MKHSFLRSWVSVFHAFILLLFAGTIEQSYAAPRINLTVNNRKVMLPLGLALTVGSMSLQKLIACKGIITADRGIITPEKTTLKTTTNTVKEQIKPSEFAVRVAKRLDGKILKVIKETGIDTDLLTTELSISKTEINMALTSFCNGNQKDNPIAQAIKNLLYKNLDPEFHAYLMVSPESMYKVYTSLSLEEKNQVLANFSIVLKGEGDIETPRTKYSKILYEKLDSPEAYKKADLLRKVSQQKADLLREISQQLATQVNAALVNSNLTEKPRAISLNSILNELKEDCGLNQLCDELLTRNNLSEEERQNLKKIALHHVLSKYLTIQNSDLFTPKIVGLLFESLDDGIKGNILTKLTKAFNAKNAENHEQLKKEKESYTKIFLRSLMFMNWNDPCIYQFIALNRYATLKTDQQKEVLQSLVNIFTNPYTMKQETTKTFTDTLRKYLLLDFCTERELTASWPDNIWQHYNLNLLSINRLYSTLPEEERKILGDLLRTIFDPKYPDRQKAAKEAYLTALKERNKILTTELLDGVYYSKCDKVSAALEKGADPYTRVPVMFNGAQVFYPILYKMIDTKNQEMAKLLLSYWQSPIHYIDFPPFTSGEEKQLFSLFDFLNDPRHYTRFHPETSDHMQLQQQQENQQSFKTELLQYFVEEGPLETLIKNIEKNENFINEESKKMLLLGLVKYSYKHVTDQNGMTTCMYDDYIARLIKNHPEPSKILSELYSALKKDQDKGKKFPRCCDHRMAVSKFNPINIIPTVTNLNEDTSSIITEYAFDFDETVHRALLKKNIFDIVTS